MDCAFGSTLKSNLGVDAAVAVVVVDREGYGARASSAARYTCPTMLGSEGRPRRGLCGPRCSTAS